MCGIFAAVSAERDVSALLLEGLTALEYRGYDSAGLAVRDDSGKTHLVRSTGKVVELERRYRTELCLGRIGIAHTRWATHGKPSEANAHPHRVGDLLLVCNGIVENHATLREELGKAGYDFNSETDTETLVALIHQHTQQAGGDLWAGIRSALPLVRGSYSFVAMQEDSDSLIAVLAGCPLVLGVGDGEMFVASDPLALARLTDQFVFFEQGDRVLVEAGGYRVEDADGNSLDRPPQHRKIAASQLDKGNYRHFTEKEIAEQPEVVRNTLAGRLGKDQVLSGALGIPAQTLRQVRHVHLVACGSAHFAAEVGAFWLEELAAVPSRTWIGSEYRYNPVTVPDDTLFVCVSQSGETADTLATLERAGEMGYLDRLAVCNVADSVMARKAPRLLLTQAGREISVLSTKAVMAQMLALQMLAIEMAQCRQMQSERTADICRQLHRLPAALEQVLALDGQIEQMAHELTEYEHVLFLGRGLQYQIAAEGALKMKESAYIHAEAYPAGELKHGPLALVNEHIPVVALIPRSEILADKMLANLQEIAARGGMLLLIAPESAPATPARTGRMPHPAPRRRRRNRPDAGTDDRPTARLPRSQTARHRRRPTPQPRQIGDCGVADIS